MESGFEEDGSLFYEQHDLVGVLNFGTFDASETGEFHYQNNHLLSYVVLEVTGLTSLEYASEKVFPALGVDPSDLSWWANNEGVSSLSALERGEADAAVPLSAVADDGDTAPMMDREMRARLESENPLFN